MCSRLALLLAEYASNASHIIMHTRRSILLTLIGVQDRVDSMMPATRKRKRRTSRPEPTSSLAVPPGRLSLPPADEVGCWVTHAGNGHFHRPLGPHLEFVCRAMSVVVTSVFRSRAPCCHTMPDLPSAAGVQDRADTSSQTMGSAEMQTARRPSTNTSPPAAQPAASLQDRCRVPVDEVQFWSMLPNILQKY